jgi:hypothetical protein
MSHSVLTHGKSTDKEANAMASNEVEILDPETAVESQNKVAEASDVNRRHFLTALGLAGAAAGAALMTSSKSAEAQQPSNPNGYAQADVLNLLLNVKYLKATLYSYITQGTDLPGSSYVTLGTGGVYNAPAKITFSSQQITDLFNEMYYDELNQLITLRSLLGAAVAPRNTINLLGTGPSGSAPSSATTTLTQSQAIALSRLLEDLSVTAFTNAAIYLTGNNLDYAMQAMATDAFHSGAVRLLAIQNNVPYQSTQYNSVATSSTAQSAVTVSGSTTTGSNVIYSILGTNVPTAGQVLTGIGIPPGAGAVITSITNTASKTPTGITTSGSSVITGVSSVSGLLVGQPITGTNIPANAYISAIGTNTLTISVNGATVNASGSSTVAPTGIVTAGSTTITGVSSVSGVIVGQAITGTGIPTGTTVTATTSSPATITISNPVTASSVIVTTGTVTAGSNLITGVSSTNGLVTAQTINGPGIPAGTTISALTPTSITLSQNATATSPAATVQFTGITTSKSTTITAVSSTAGLSVGQLIAGANIPNGATITAIGSNTITISAAATATSTISPSGTTTAGSNVITGVTSVTGLIVGNAISGTGIPSTATITAIGTNTITISANATSTASAPEVLTSPSPEALFGGGETLTIATTETLTTPTTETLTVGQSQIVLAGNATATGINTFYVVLTDPDDVEPGDPGSAATSAAGPVAVAGTSPAIYEGFFNTAGAGTNSATNTPAGFAFARTFQQVLAVLYGYNSSNSTIATQNYEGGFYPYGVSGNIVSVT